MKTKRLTLINADQNNITLTITETNESIGYIHIAPLDNNETCIKLQFGLHSHKGENYTKEALEALIPTLFEQGIHRIESEIPAYNTSSHKLLKALGFELEGTRRQAHYENEKYHDVHLFALIERIPSTNPQDYLNYVTPYYTQTETLHNIMNNLALFDPQSLNLPKLYFLATFHGLLKSLQTDPMLMGQTLSKLSSLNWTSEQIKDALYSLERQLTTPQSEEEKIIHDLYTLEQFGAPEIAKALSVSGAQHELFNKIKQNNFEFFTTIGKEIGEERLTYTKKIIQEL